MEQSRNLKIANLEVEISLLRREERRLREQIAFPSTAPELRAEAQTVLARTLEKIRFATNEIARLESEL